MIAVGANILDGVSIQDSGTVRFYAENAESYLRATLGLDMSAIYGRFLEYLEPGDRILDAGSGSGRDTLEFLRRGYVVKAFDASAALAAFSSKLTGVKTHVVRFEEFESDDRFDGIWSCAALLHVRRQKLPDALGRLLAVLKARGVLYASFKLGQGDRTESDGRLFTDLDEEDLLNVLQQVPSKPQVCEMWRTFGEGHYKGRSAWFNVILRRV